MTVRVALQGPQTQAGVGSPAAPAHAQPPASPLQGGLCFPTPCCCTARRRHWRQRLWNVEASERILCSPVRPAQVAVGLLSCLREACCPSRWSGAAFFGRVLLQPQPWGLLPRVQVLASHLYFKHTAPTASFSISFCLGFRKCLIVLDRRPDHRQEWCGTQSLPGFRSAPLKILVINLDQGICSELWKNSSCITLKCNLCLK